MKTKKRNAPRNKPAIIAITVAVLLLAISGVYLYLHNQQKQVDTQSLNSDKQQAENLIKNPEDKQTTPNTDKAQPAQTDKQTGKGIAVMTASASVSGGNLYVRGGINNAVVSDGTCYAILTSSAGETIRKDTTLLQNPSTTDCKTITLATSELSDGDWSVKLYYSSDSMEGASNAVSIKI